MWKIKKLWYNVYTFLINPNSSPSCTVEVIVSSRPGVGKTLAIKRYAQKLQQHLGRGAYGKEVLVTVPLQTAQVEEDGVISALLPHQQASYNTQPQIFHLDVAPMVRRFPTLFFFLVELTEN